ncbi:unnamed protein product [Arctia plantaginis]|uniref:Uncharacterized protein n=1 Tax=Arctia plantaginis TaxID=874455 RepID=A0A8S1B294_ARCPL|nr:unnamed protein product [Arctia plantaginis]
MHLIHGILLNDSGGGVKEKGGVIGEGDNPPIRQCEVAEAVDVGQKKRRTKNTALRDAVRDGKIITHAVTDLTLWKWLPTEIRVGVVVICYQFLLFIPET